MVTGPQGSHSERKSCSHCKWKPFIILSLQMGVSYQTFSLFSSLHLSFPSHCIYHSLSLPASDSTCICCPTFPAHSSLSSFYILSVLLLVLISVFGVNVLFIRDDLISRHRIFMDKCGSVLPVLRLPCDADRGAYSFVLFYY